MSRCPVVAGCLPTVRRKRICRTHCGFFSPGHALLEQWQVGRAWEEARQLAPKPRLLVFAAFQFDPEAAKDIDEMKPLAGMQFLERK
ncbi:MAG: hypothetical protein NZ585_10505 [Chloracidobacterium sp.]|nr:hypothetical protein [Chloracidobacterium sp.]